MAKKAKTKATKKVKVNPNARMGIPQKATDIMNKLREIQVNVGALCLEIEAMPHHNNLWLINGWMDLQSAIDSICKGANVAVDLDKYEGVQSKVKKAAPKKADAKTVKTEKAKPVKAVKAEKTSNVTPIKAIKSRGRPRKAAAVGV